MNCEETFNIHDVCKCEISVSLRMKMTVFWGVAQCSVAETG
jgi:hypothetical protein